MRLFLAAPLLAAFVLSACDRGDSVRAENESAESVGRKIAASDIRPQPGRWESSVKMEDFKMEGLPPQAREMMAKEMAVAEKVTSCLTPEQVDRPDGAFFAGGAEGCTYRNFTMAGGRLDAEMVCEHKGMKQTMAMNGSYSETQYDIRVNSQAEVQPGKPMELSLAVASRRVGECDGKEDVSAEDVARGLESLKERK